MQIRRTGPAPGKDCSMDVERKQAKEEEEERRGPTPRSIKEE